MSPSGKTLRADGQETRARLKEVAQRLFAERGLDGVSVQDIVSAAGQRNNASLRYYFGSKQALAAELLVDGARLIDEHRQAMLDQMEAQGQVTVRSMIEALTLPLLALSERTGQSTYIRMVANLQLNQRTFVREALEDRWNTGYKRCFAHLAELLPQVPRALLEQRFSLAGGIYGNAVWAAWEAAQDAAQQEGFTSRLWAAPFAIDNVLDTLQGMLECAPSTATLAKLDAG